jgi:hypothetical protein
MSRSPRRHAYDGFVRAEYAPGSDPRGFVRATPAPAGGAVASFAPSLHSTGDWMASFAPIPRRVAGPVASFIAFLPVRQPCRPPFWQGWVRLLQFSRPDPLPFWQGWVRLRGLSTRRSRSWPGDRPEIDNAQHLAPTHARYHQTRSTNKSITHRLVTPECDGCHQQPTNQACDNAYNAIPGTIALLIQSSGLPRSPIPN